MVRLFLSFFILCLVLFFQDQKGYAQALDTSKLDLNSGGMIHDVVYDQWHDCYIIVGSFTQIKGVSRKNFACINRVTMQVETTSYLNPIQSMNGEIRCVDITRTLSFGVYTYHLFLGGNFSSITVGGTASTRLGIVKLTATQNTIAPYTHSNFSVNLWNADLDMTPLLTGISSQGVDDILITNDTVIFSGGFLATDSGTLYQTRDGLAAYKIGGINALSYPAMAGAGYNQSRYYCIRKKGANLYAGGYIGGGGMNNGRLFKLDATGNNMGAFNYDYAGLRAVYSFEFHEDSLIYIIDDRASESAGPDCFVVIRQSNGTQKLNHSLSPFSTNMIGNIAAGITSLSVYKSDVYVKTLQAGKYVIGAESQGQGPSLTAPDWNASVPVNLNTNLFGNVHVAGNRIFISSTNLTTLSGQPRSYLGSYFLEPEDAGEFTIFDTMICAGDTAVYGILPVKYANGYRWQYTGSGADLGNNGSIDVSPYDISSNSISIHFTESFTPGILMITPYSNCDGITKIFSNTVSINIHSNPVPNIHAGNDTVITCYNELTGVQLYGYSDSVIVSEVWSNLSGFPTYAGPLFTATDTGNYIYKVTSPLGCPNFDTVHVGLNKTKPIALPPATPYEINCANPVQFFSGSTPTSNSISHWYINSGDSIQNPISVNTPGIYYYRVRDTLNGCFKDTGIYVSLDNDPPNIAITGYPGAFGTIETLTCIQDTLNLNCYSDSSNTITSWINSDTTVFFGTNLEITSDGFYHLFATDNDNGCTNSLNIFIAENINVPGVGTAPFAELNCSVDSLILSGASLTVGATTQWTGLSISSSTNPVTIFNAGTYYITATHPDNGCISIDSTVVAATSTILVSAGNDTLVCNLENVPVAVNYIGTIGGINYQWDNGSTTQNSTYTAGIQPYAIAQVYGNNGCYGTDSVFFNLPPNATVLFEGFKPCDNSPSGQIVATPLSGLDPFQYSIDSGTTFQTSQVFTGLYMGTYPILVRDSINCEYNFTAVIDGNSSLPSPSFLFSTYNFTSDTVAIIDVSNPPTDSTVWLFPPQLVVLDSNPLSPMILMPDTGMFIITMQAFYGNCKVEMSKTIYASPYDSLAATRYNLNGIKSIELYPNPTTGNFTIVVEFYKSQRSAMVVQDMIGNTYVFNEYNESTVITENIFLDFSVIDGSYVLKVVSEFDSATVTFVLAR